jgi:hypothetical protein
MPECAPVGSGREGPGRAARDARGAAARSRAGGGVSAARSRRRVQHGLRARAPTLGRQRRRDRPDRRRARRPGAAAGHRALGARADGASRAPLSGAPAALAVALAPARAQHHHVRRPVGHRRLRRQDRRRPERQQRATGAGLARARHHAQVQAGRAGGRRADRHDANRAVDKGWSGDFPHADRPEPVDHQCRRAAAQCRRGAGRDRRGHARRSRERLQQPDLSRQRPGEHVARGHQHLTGLGRARVPLQGRNRDAHAARRQADRQAPPLRRADRRAADLRDHGDRHEGRPGGHVLRLGALGLADGRRGIHQAPAEQGVGRRAVLDVPQVGATVEREQVEHGRRTRSTCRCPT